MKKVETWDIVVRISDDLVVVDQLRLDVARENRVLGSARVGEQLPSIDTERGELQRPVSCFRKGSMLELHHTLRTRGKCSYTVVIVRSITLWVLILTIWNSTVVRFFVVAVICEGI